jgi:hypothetical protein
VESSLYRMWTSRWNKCEESKDMKKKGYHLVVWWNKSLFLVEDFNETLHHFDISSKYLNFIGSNEFCNFITNCNLLEYHLIGHSYTRFQGQLINRIDRSFTTPNYHLIFSGLTLTCYPKDLSNHCQMLLWM